MSCTTFEFCLYSVLVAAADRSASSSVGDAMQLERARGICEQEREKNISLF